MKENAATAFMGILVLTATLLGVSLIASHTIARSTSKLNIHYLNLCDDMTIEQFLKEVNKPSVEQLTYDEMLSYLERNKDISTKRNLSYDEAYWLGRLYDEKQINNSEYKKGLKLLRQSIKEDREFCRIFLEAEDPTGKYKDHWEFYLEDYMD